MSLIVAEVRRIERRRRREHQAGGQAHRRDAECGNDVVVAVSAMGDTTDELIDLAHEVTPLPDPREMDMLLTPASAFSMAFSLLRDGDQEPRS